ncbi:MAG: hypothetical protein ACKOC1_03585 [Hyphomicrobiales bacterium]
MTEPKHPSQPGLTPEQLAQQRSRSKALGLILGSFAILFFVVTIAKLGSSVFNRPL